MQVHYILYSRQECPLCDTAAALLDTVGVAWAERCIDQDIALLSKYRNRIPVLLRCDTESELAWPFDQARLAQFIL